MKLLLATALALTLAASAAAQTGAPDPPVRGPAGAILEIVEFSDFQCPYCAGALPVIDSLLSRYPEEVRLVYRHFPIPEIHEHAESASIAAIEAHRQGAFWAYHDVLFERQDRLSDGELVGHAASLGLDATAVAEALRRRSHAEWLAADVELGRALGVRGTPTFFFNGYRMVGVPPLWVFEEVLRAFRAVEPAD